MFFILPILSCPPTPPLFVRARVDVLSPKNKSVLNGIIRSYTRYNRNVLKDMKGDGMRNSTNIQLTTKWILWVGYFFFGKINCVPWYFIPFCIPISLDWLCARVVGVCVCGVCALSMLPIRFQKRFQGNRKRVWFLNQISMALHWIFRILFLFQLFLFKMLYEHKRTQSRAATVQKTFAAIL